MECNKCKRIVEKYCQIAGKDIYECFDDSECREIWWDKIEKEKSRKRRKRYRKSFKIHSKF